MVKFEVDQRSKGDAIAVISKPRKSFEADYFYDLAIQLRENFG